MSSNYEALTEKEKQTLRLIVRGYDAKSIARHLDLSVHTINERLREARRKMAVSSSREAARMVLDHEGDTPNYLGDEQIGDAKKLASVEQDAQPTNGGRRTPRLVWITIGGAIVTLLIGLLALTLAPPPTVIGGATTNGSDTAAATTDAKLEGAARQWLALLDQGRWDDSWKATGKSFRSLNTTQVWASASKKVRAPLGALISRTLISQDSVPAPPQGYEVIKFRTRFANKADAVETVTFNYEDGGWRVVGIYIS